MTINDCMIIGINKLLINDLRGLATHNSLKSHNMLTELHRAATPLIHCAHAIADVIYICAYTHVNVLFNVEKKHRGQVPECIACNVFLSSNCEEQVHVHVYNAQCNFHFVFFFRKTGQPSTTDKRDILLGVALYSIAHVLLCEVDDVQLHQCKLVDYPRVVYTRLSHYLITTAFRLLPTRTISMAAQHKGTGSPYSYHRYM